MSIKDLRDKRVSISATHVRRLEEELHAERELADRLASELRQTLVMSDARLAMGEQIQMALLAHELRVKDRQ